MGNVITNQDDQDLMNTKMNEYSHNDAPSEFYEACRRGDIYTVQRRLANFPLPNPNKLEPNESTALHAASYFGHVSIVRLIVQRCSINYLERNRYGFTAYEESYNDEIRQILQPAQDATIKRRAWPALLELTNSFQQKTEDILRLLLNQITAGCFIVVRVSQIHDLFNQASIIIDAKHVKHDELMVLLNKLSSIKAPLPTIYVLIDSLSDEFVSSLSTFPHVKGVFENAESLIVRWALNTALEHRKIGYELAGCNEKREAERNFNESIALYERLATIVQSKKRLT